MQHAAVVAGLVLAHRVFLFEHGDGRAGKPLAQPVGRGQPHDAAAHNHDPFHQYFSVVPASRQVTANHAKITADAASSV